MATGSSVDSPDAGVRLSTLSPKYLHTNSTSHTWPFSAIAELIDNAYDPDVNASQLWIDVKKYPKHNYCLVFTDYGAGMGPEKLHKMLSFGFCDKVAKKGQHMPVGHYGNGFKSGSMRLGRDAIVFTKNANSKSVGFLSQTYLDAIKAETILVPMVTWDTDGKITPKSDKEKALKDILTYSIFRRKEELLAEFATIQNPSGTRIIIFNVRTTPDGKPEFDFSIDDDIRIPKDTDVAITKLKRQERQNHIPESDYSLRAYCAILYLRPRMQIMLRGKKVRTTVITKSLSKTEVDTYRPSVRENTPVIPANVNKAVKITFGFSQNKNHYGIMMYHRNRLIKPYVRVGYQLRANNLGVGVVGVIECDFLQPTHNKQDFDYTKAYRACIAALGNKLNDYWNEKKGPQRANSKEPIPEPVEVQQGPDQSWVQCDNLDCLKWRKLPDGTNLEKLPDKWYCQDSPYPHMRSCDIPEEKEDEIEQPYVKTQKKRLEKEMEDRKRKEKEAKQNQEEEAKRLEQQRKELEKKEVELDRLKKQLSEMQSTSESAILQSIEVNSTRQQQAIQQQLKGEKKSPQPLRFKVVTQPPSASRVNIKQEPQRTASSSTDSNIQTTQVDYGAEAAASSTPQPIKIKIEKIDRPQVNGIKRAHEEDSDVIEQPPKQKPRQEREVIIIDDPPSPTIKKNFTPQIRHELDLKDVDNDLITTLRKLSPEEQWIRLAKSAQQLRCLRDDVCKLLRILVPEIELGERAEILDNTTVDDLLKQVLEANVKPTNSES
ncbi:MORC family CW-type zinc finger protein 3-like isoform X3 [Acropora millepora]|uniref:MORC family CW-type zinc finger protein 3-like isoform X3 n=1 Tax=Acropora millepora TaxID=45264 RepID=UPI001CF24F3F|nr:MORC family CW-type zinc finger protein 3-like isoform X3 [Acropora millepora]